MTIEILEHSISDTISRQSNQFNSIEKTEENSTPQVMKRPTVQIINEMVASEEVSSEEDEEGSRNEKQQVISAKRHSGTIGNTKFQYGSKGAIPSPLGSAHSFDLQVKFFLLLFY